MQIIHYGLGIFPAHMLACYMLTMTPLLANVSIILFGKSPQPQEMDNEQGGDTIWPREGKTIAGIIASLKMFWFEMHGPL